MRFDILKISDILIPITNSLKFIQMLKHKKVFKKLGIVKLRRNDVVFVNNFYGRVARRIDYDHVEVIDTGKYINIYADTDLNREDEYVGYWDSAFSDLRRNYPIFRWMPTLRKLKQSASYYNNAVWKKHRKKTNVL